jgi:LPPG:FO 2-phospho-L-lactate transferase
VITVLCGGFGAARFLTGLVQVEADVTCVVNTADDLEYEGLHVSPDVDTVCYALAGRFDEERGWGLRGDSFRNAGALRRYGSGWFAVGDEDLATHLRRTFLLRAGATLTEATADLAGTLGVPARVLPMSDDPVRTRVITADGALSFQDFLVRHRARPRVRGVELVGADDAKPAPGVIDAVRDADLVIVAPSNPVASITPILGLPGVAAALADRPGPTVAVTPVVSGQPPATLPERSRAHVRAAFMASRGLEHRALSVARVYRRHVDGFVLDHRDAGEQPAIEALGIHVLLADTLARPAARPALAAAVVRFGHLIGPGSGRPTGARTPPGRPGPAPPPCGSLTYLQAPPDFT